ncbi:serine hydrolase [Taylorella asinigenitalis]|uniref:serine hydrolase n=1 Tax=Taylorella asinigenitalis TaxID=84590 RepID=UPI00048C4ACC|nr:serine hydrolase [Taylorella asinigenitalis]
MFRLLKSAIISISLIFFVSTSFNQEVYAATKQKTSKTTSKAKTRVKTKISSKSKSKKTTSKAKSSKNKKKSKVIASKKVKPKTARKLKSKSSIVKTKSNLISSSAGLANDSEDIKNSFTDVNIVGFADNGDVINSEIAFVMSLDDRQIHYQKNIDTVQPIASITKLMTAYVVIKGGQSLDEIITISEEDMDRLKGTGSRLTYGTQLTRREALLLALMSSENRAANALGRHYPGGLEAFVKQMNATARQIGMTRTRFVEPTGLSPQNVASAQDLAKLLAVVYREPLIHQFSTSDGYTVTTNGGKIQNYKNSNRLIRNDKWDIHVSKTGYIKEAGRCIVMITKMNGKDMAVVLMNANGGVTRFSDAIRIKHIVQNDFPSIF